MGYCAKGLTIRTPGQEDQPGGVCNGPRLRNKSINAILHIIIVSLRCRWILCLQRMWQISGLDEESSRGITGLAEDAAQPTNLLCLGVGLALYTL